jgi:ubiquinone/menaquinone biosynthesis C-methylase UbiE
VKTQTKGFLMTIGVTAGAVAGLRFYSRRQSTPCPPWLDWLLENPYVNLVAGDDTILDRVEVAPGMRVLDVGCGPGRLAVPAAQRVGPSGEVVALDIQEEMLRRTRIRAAQAGLKNVHTLHAAAGEGQTPERTFDRAWLVTVLGEIPNREAALAEVFAALKPGGLLSVTELIPDPHYQSRSTVRRLAAGAGFVEQAAFGNWLAFTLNFIKPVEKTAA